MRKKEPRWSETLSEQQNFNREAGLFHSILYTKLFALLLLALSCLGTKGVINEKITWSRIWAVLGAGFVFYFIINWWMLLLPIHADVVTALYILTISIGYICLMMAGLWMSRLLKHHLMEDVFNNENLRLQTKTFSLKRNRWKITCNVCWQKQCLSAAQGRKFSAFLFAICRYCRKFALG